MYRLMIKRFFAVAIASLFISGSLFAQAADTEGRGGSAYSFYGLGTPIDLSSDAFKAYGVLGVSGTSLEVNSLANPAIWSRAVYTEATTGLVYSTHMMENTSGSSENKGLQSGYVHLTLPLSRNKLGMSVGLFPVTRANFRAIDVQTVEVNEDESFSYQNELQSIGGVNKFEVGFGFRLNRNFSIGYAPSVAFLTLEKSEFFTFSPNFNAQGQRISQDQKRKFSGAAFSQRFGLAGRFNGLLKNDDRLNVGVTVSLPYKIGVKQDFTTTKLVGGTSEEIDLSSTLTNPDGDIEMPFETSFGLGYSPSRFISFAAEGLIQKWGDYSSEIQPEEGTYMTDRMKVGFGSQFHPYRGNSSSFFSRFKYSAGLSYDSGHLTLEGNDISTLWLNTGLGILSKSASSIDISFQYGFRGTTDNNLIKERIWALGFSVNLTELMFIRPKLR
jgi:hypothetical protein